MRAHPTIYALASAAGRAGVAVFRISGPAARQALIGLGVEKPLEPRVATLVTLRTPSTRHQASDASRLTTHDSRLIDTALALYFPAPYSFTGEDVVELHTHGSRAVVKLLLEALNGFSGLRMAEPGEFARRAFLNGKLDLAQAEGLADLIDADTRAQQTQAMRQLTGATTRRVVALRGKVLEPMALMEAYIDFPDEEIPESVLTQAQTQITSLVAELAALLEDNSVGEKIREGLEIVILGAPNVGKSSLLNALARREAAIVSPEAGTTRDLIEVQMDIGGYAVTLVDTAGIREAAGSIESEGIRRALHRAEHADITLRLYDVAMVAESPLLTPPLQGEEIIIVTKSDLGPLPSLPFPAIAISTKTGAGMEVLIEALKDKVEAVMGSSGASPLITRARHREALGEALTALTRFDVHAPLELACEELRVAATSIGKITGKIWVDDVLDLVFSRFCIGK